MFSLRYYVVDTVVLMIIGFASFRYRRTWQMATPILLALRKDRPVHLAFPPETPAPNGRESG